MNRLRVIHVGLGQWGMNWVAQVLGSHPDVEVVAYVDGDVAMRENAVGPLGCDSGRIHASLAAALEAGPVDCVIICVPTPFHAPLAAEALEAGKHVLLEKPFTSTVAEAEALISLAEQRGLVLAVSQNYRYYAPPQLAAGLVRDASLGRLLSVKIDFRRNAKVEGHGYLGIDNPLLVDMAVHHYDLMRMILGETAEQIHCVTWNPPASPFRMDPSGMMVFRYPSGVIASYRGSWLDQGPQTTWSGEWQMDFERGAVFWSARDELPDTQYRDSITVQRLNAPPQHLSLKRLPFHDRAGVLRDFAKAIRGEPVPAFFPTAASNVGTIKTIAAVLKSAAQGGTPATV